MECTVCLEIFNSDERRPKSLPCGHSFCLACLLQMHNRKCPVDSKVFKSPIAKLPDNFSVLEACNSNSSSGLRLWCRICNKNATEQCVDEHGVDVCSLKKARREDAQPLVAALQQGEAALDSLWGTLDDTAVVTALEGCRGHLESEKANLAAVRQGLQDAQDANSVVWNQAKEAAYTERGLGRTVSNQLAEDLADPAASCSVSVQRRGGDDVWQGKFQLADYAAARLLLCQLACHGKLQQQEQQLDQKQELDQQQQSSTAAPRPPWHERSNEEEGEVTLEETSARIEAGCTVVRGWGKDFLPAGPGTVIEKGSGGLVSVSWCRTGRIMFLNVDAGEVRLQAPAPLTLQIGQLTREHFVDLATIKDTSKILITGNLEKVRFLAGLACHLRPSWSDTVLDEVRPHLQGLGMVCPLQRHLDVVVKMPHLQSLSITGVTGQQLQMVSQMASLRRLELHCPLDAPLPVLAFPATPAGSLTTGVSTTGLRSLRCGIHPLQAALELMRAHAGSLDEIELVAATTEPYGCPDLAKELQDCGLRKLKWVVLLRQDAYGAYCRHDTDSCVVQVRRLLYMLRESNADVTVTCSVCVRRRAVP